MVTRGFEAKYRILELLELRGKPCISAYDFKFQQLFHWILAEWITISLFRKKYSYWDRSWRRQKWRRIRTASWKSSCLRTVQTSPGKTQHWPSRWWTSKSSWTGWDITGVLVFYESELKTHFDIKWYGSTKFIACENIQKWGGGCNIAARNKENYILNIMFHVGLTTKNNIYIHTNIKVMHICVVRGISVNLICL